MDGLGAAMLKSADPIGVLKSRYDTLKATLAANTQSNRDQVDAIVMAKTATQSLSDSLDAEQSAQIKAMLAGEEHKKTLKDTAGAGKAAADAYQAHIDQLKIGIATLKANAAAVDEGKVKTDGAALAAATYLVTLGKFKDLTQPQKDLILTLAAQKDAWESNVKAAEDFAAAVKKANEDSLKDLQKYNQDKIDTVTKATQNLTDLTTQNNIALLGDAQQQAQAQLQIEMDKWQRIIGLAKDGTQAQKDLIAAYNAWLASQQNVEYLKSIKATADSIQSIMTDAFDNIFTHSKNIAQEIRDFFIKSFDKLVLTPIIQPIAQSMAGGVTSLFTRVAAGSTSGAAANGVMSSIGSSMAGSTLGTSVLGAFGDFSAGMTTGSLGFSGAMDYAGAFLANGQVAAGLGSVAGALGTVLPIVGIVAGIASMLGAFDHGGPKSGGGSISNYTTSGSSPAAYSQTAYGTTVNNVGQGWITDTQNNAAMKSVTDGLFASYSALATTLGQKVGTAQFGIGANTDPQGTAGNMYYGRASINGQMVYNLATNDANSRGDAAAQAQIDKMAAQMLEASIVPAFTAVSADLGKIAASFTGSLADTATYLQGLATVAQYMKANPLQDALTQISTASQTAYQNLFAAGVSLKTMASSVDGSLASVKQLSTATSAMYQSELAMIGQIQGMMVSLPGMFNTSIDTIKMSVMSNGDKYDYLRSKADADYAALGKTTDPAQIQTLATEINNLVNQAYGLQDATGQATNTGATQTYLQQVSDLVTKQLTAAQTSVTQLHDSTVSAITDALGPVAASMQTAATTMQSAAETPVTVTGSASIFVQVGENTSQEVALFGS
jgi:hypothetical protein